MFSSFFPSPLISPSRALVRFGLLCLVLGIRSAPAEIDQVRLPPPATHPIDFESEVWPILEHNCLSCHGPERQNSDLRFDVRSIALKGGAGHAPNIVPGDSAASPLIHFIAGLDPKIVMPEKGDRLSDAEVGILRAWIDQGATWPDTEKYAGNLDAWKSHWAFQPLPPSPASSSSDTTPPSLVLDTFVRDKLTEQGLTLSPPADRATLIRRLSFDLIGLPPTPAELTAFLHDSAPGAYERLVERLLASPHYGERWARHWLDVVRFAESDGFERNNLRPDAYHYRDYVIQAFNEDLPYDRFVREQLAGDALGADAATGFIVGGAFDFLQSFEPPLFNAGQRADELADMVGTTGGTFLGLTLACARCHDHKFDPVSQADYYSMTAIFQGVEHGKRPHRPSNYEDLLRQAAPLQQRVSEINEALAPYAPLARPTAIHVIEPRLPRAERQAHPEGTEPGQTGYAGDELSLPTLSDGFAIHPVDPPAMDPPSPWLDLPTGRFRVWISWSVAGDRSTDVTYRLANAGESLNLATVDQTSFADGRPYVADEARWSGLRAIGVHEFKNGSRLQLHAPASQPPATVDLVLLEEVLPQADSPHVITPHLRPPVVVKANDDRFPPIEAKFLRFTVLASNTPEGYLDELEVFTAEPTPRNVALREFGAQATSPLVNGLDGNPFYANDRRYNERAAWSSPPDQPGYLQIEFARAERIDHIRWSRNRSTRAPDLDDHLVTAYHVDVSRDGQQWTRVASSEDRLPPSFRESVPQVPTLSQVPEVQHQTVAALVAERRPLQEQIWRLVDFPLIYAGEMREPGPSYRLHRGDILQRKEQVPPAAPTHIGAPMVLPTDAPEQQRRLALGDWLVDPDNPLPARVMVNRLWHYHFGTGLVDTPSDFGMNGARPTHPELLDWLARQFIDRNWRIKSMHRLIVHSQTYRQASKPHPEGLRLDAAARYLWRYPPRRMEAEALRDSILSISGTLNPTKGGPGFFLFDSEVSRSGIQLYESKTEFETPDFRRMIYQLKPRAQLDDVFGAFDCPDAGQIAPNRTRSTTPLQAFNLMNSPFILQQADAFAERLTRDAGSVPDAQIQRAFQLAFGRIPAPEEAAASLDLIRKHGLSRFCRVIFNTIEFITIY